MTSYAPDVTEYPVIVGPRWTDLFDEPSVQKAWDESLHPRGRGGLFIEPRTDVAGASSSRPAVGNDWDPGGTGEVTVDGHMAKAFGAASGLTLAEVKKLMDMKSVAPLLGVPLGGVHRPRGGYSQGRGEIWRESRRGAGRILDTDGNAYKLKWPEKGA